MTKTERFESLIETKKKRVSALEKNIKLQNADIEKLIQKVKKMKDAEGNAT